MLNAGYITPEAFSYLDSSDYVHDMNSISVIYDVKRHVAIKNLLNP